MTLFFAMPVLDITPSQTAALLSLPRDTSLARLVTERQQTALYKIEAHKLAERVGTFWWRLTPEGLLVVQEMRRQAEDMT